MTGSEVVLRSIEEADAERLASWQADEVFCAHAGWNLATAREDSVTWWCAQIAEPDPKLTRLLALCDAEPVGYVDLYGDEPDTRELGYVIAPASRWGQGLGTSAAQAALAYGFSEVGLGRIWAEAIEANTASVRVLERVGMRQTGFGAAENFLEHPSRYVQFEMLRTEWLTSRP